MRFISINFYASIIVFCTMVFSAIQVKAQQQAVDKMAQAMTDSLSFLHLTDQQKPQVLNLDKTAASSLVQVAKKAKTDTSMHGKVLCKQVMGVMKQRNDGLNKLLSPDQQKLFSQHQVEQLADLQTKMMAAQLNLSEDQLPQVYQVNLKSTGEMMKEAAALKEAKGKLKKFKDVKAMKSDSKDQDKALKQILTPEQYDKYEKNKEAQQEAMKEKMKESKK